MNWAKKPEAMECAGEFDLHGLHYYMFRFKRSLLEDWLLGVCGGYEKNSLEHCGHVFSRMERYDVFTAKQQAIEMVEMIREYWMQKAKEAEENGDISSKGSVPFAGFILLDSYSWNPRRMATELQNDWGVRLKNEEAGKKSGAESLTWEVDDMLVAASLMPAPVPNNEALEAAANNYLWPQAKEVTANHKAHIVVAVISQSEHPLVVGQLFVKVCSTFLKQKNAVGIYTSGTVFEPAFYREAAEMLRSQNLPLFNWIHFGLYQSDHGVGGYTYGMSLFGKDEIEVLDSKASAEEVRDFLYQVAYFVLAHDIVLQAGETIGFSSDQKLPITKSAGVALDCDTIKIAY